jgi:hypothetical protein
VSNSARFQYRIKNVSKWIYLLQWVLCTTVRSVPEMHQIFLTSTLVGGEWQVHVQTTSGLGQELPVPFEQVDGWVGVLTLRSRDTFVALAENRTMTLWSPSLCSATILASIFRLLAYQILSRTHEPILLWRRWWQVIWISTNPVYYNSYIINHLPYHIKSLYFAYKTHAFQDLIPDLSIRNTNANHSPAKESKRAS